MYYCLFGCNRSDKDKKHYKKNNIAQNIISPSNEEVILTKNELPRLDASVLTQPLMTSIVKRFYRK